MENLADTSICDPRAPRRTAIFPAAKRPIRPRARRGAALPRPRSVQCGPRLSREPLLCSHRACRTTTLHTASGQFRGGLAGNGWVPRGTQLHGSPPLSLTASRTQKPLFCVRVSKAVHKKPGFAYRTAFQRSSVHKSPCFVYRNQTPYTKRPLLCTAQLFKGLPYTKAPVLRTEIKSRTQKGHFCAPNPRRGAALTSQIP
jgi:hypothetical protein